MTLSLQPVFSVSDMCLCLADQRRYSLGFFIMGNSCSNLGIPPGKGPNAVGCTDFMMDHTAKVYTKTNIIHVFVYLCCFKY